MPLTRTLGWPGSAVTPGTVEGAGAGAGAVGAGFAAGAG
jgi:hypothetical protein